ncbi:MAG TPA: xanthine dehydrogenase family protein molybdopterin-binding subunit [Acidimicrobiia bacterium]|nr:xanthine dehydrogenase family protein molybdopterin-binding subunit [Acidimicrobiia bacterium]
MPGSILGTEVRRVEDPDLLVGRAQFVDDLRSAPALELVFVRSPYAHARITSIDVTEAQQMPGVAAVFTAADLGLAPYEGLFVLNRQCKRPPLAEDKVRFVGDAVAAVLATTRAQAMDAVETVVVDYEPLDAAVDPEAALASDAPLQFEELGSNLAASIAARDTSDVLDDADVVVRARIENQRVAVMPMEGNAILVAPDVGEHELTVWVSTQMPHGFAGKVNALFDLDASRLRVIAPHVGGAFGGKPGLAPEHMVAVAAASRLKQPVRWVETRSENLIAMPHGRGQVQYVQLGCKRDGTITGMKCEVVGDSGAYAGFGGALPMGSTRMMAQGVYHIPRIAYSCAVALTNTTPMGAFRGAGRPEAAAMVERMIDFAAAELGIDPAEMRRRNFIRPDEFPYKTVTRATYDNGDYDHALTEALRAADYDALRKEQAQRRERGDRVQLGIGLATYVEVTGGQGGEYASVRINADGTATIRVGTSAHGQGHATAFAMIVADRLHIPLEQVHFVQSDTAEVPEGSGTGGSRSLQMGGTSVLHAADNVIDQAKELAASMLEADPADIVINDDGRVGVAGVPASALSWAELATEGELYGLSDWKQEGSTFPFGAHVAVVEVDLDTGRVTPRQHVAVDDCGRILNPLIVRGQQHGGIAQGIAQALWEHYIYDDDGNPLTSTLTDYGMPSAAELPSYDALNTETPTPQNDLGAKGIGESGTIGSTPAVQNAVIDAVSYLGIRHIDMPCTSERVWRAVRDAKQGIVPEPWREPPPVFATLGGPVQRADADAIDI